MSRERGILANVPGDKMVEPCAEYRVDLHAASFGQCMCGAAKQDHAPEAFKRGSSIKSPKGSKGSSIRKSVRTRCVVRSRPDRPVS